VIGTPLGEADVEPFNWALAEMGRACSALQYLRTVDWLFGYTRRVAQWWADGFDLLLTPTLPEPAWTLGGFHGVDVMMAGFRAQTLCAFTGPFNMTGQPGSLCRSSGTRPASRSACSWSPPTGAKICCYASPGSSRRRARGRRAGRRSRRKR